MSRRQESLPPFVPPAVSQATEIFINQLPEFYGTSDRHVLDIGSGNGGDVLHLALRGFINIVGIDNDPMKIAIAENERNTLAMRSKKGKNPVEKVSFVQAEVRDYLASVANKESIIICNDVIPGLNKADQKDVINSIKNRTRNMGFNVISSLVADKNAASTELADRLPDAKDILSAYDDNKWKLQLARVVPSRSPRAPAGLAKAYVIARRNGLS